jgi:hypothetical protein
MKRNKCPLYTGTGVRFAPEYTDDFVELIHLLFSAEVLSVFDCIP